MIEKNNYSFLKRFYMFGVLFYVVSNIQIDKMHAVLTYLKKTCTVKMFKLFFLLYINPFLYAF